MPVWTREQAAIYAKAGAYARWHAPKPPKPMPQEDEALPQVSAPAVLDARSKEVVQLLREQIELTRGVLAGRLEPKDRAQLLGALDRLLERERVWSQRPAAANVKVTTGNTRQRALPSLPAGWETDHEPDNATPVVS